MNWKGIYSGWIKNYSDGSFLIAKDVDIQRKKVSWRKSRNTGIVSIGIKYGTTIGEIYGPGEYWQSDMFVVNFPYSEVKIIRRNIQKKVDQEDKFISIIETKNYIGLTYTSATFSFSAPEKSGSQLITLNDNDIGKWFTLSLDIGGREGKKIQHSLLKEML